MVEVSDKGKETVKKKKVEIFGASGHIGKYITKRMKADKEYDLLMNEELGVNENLGITN